jgi:transcriptional regulator
MYIPFANAETRIPVMHELILAHPLATLVTMGSSGLLASHIPMVLHAADGEFGTLRGHVARGNPQWREADLANEALAIFAGPQHYITPNWYVGKSTHGKEVPTWNYAVVHAYGMLRVVEDEDWLLPHLESLTDRHEAGAPVPWKVSDAPANFIQSLLKGIVGLELPIRRIEGKWKASQNRKPEDQAGVIEGLGALGKPESMAMQEMVRERCPFAGKVG